MWEIKDPGQKIDALRHFVSQYPRSRYVTSAKKAILETTIKAWPGDSKRIQHEATQSLKGVSGGAAIWLSDAVADKLVDGGVCLPMAEALSRRNLKRYSLVRFLNSSRRQDAEEKQNPPPEAELEREWRSNRAALLQTLGRAEFKRGRTAEAERHLKQAYADDPTSGDAALVLSEIAAGRGDKAAAVDYAIVARLAGAKGSEVELEGLYRGLHDGSIAGLEAALDAAYRTKFPAPVHPHIYKPGPDRTRRTVLAEVFTGAGCPPCAGADAAFDGVLERYPRNDVAVLMYHQHIPLPDPMANPDTKARAQYYAIQAVPSYAIDGTVHVGGSPRADSPALFQNIDAMIAKRLATPAAAYLAVDASESGRQIRARVFVEGIKIGSTEQKLQIALVEDLLHYSGENGLRFHPMVVRSLAGPDGAGFSLSASNASAFEWTFDLDKISARLRQSLDEYESKGHRGSSFTFLEKKFQIDSANLSMVAYVEDAKAKQILQTAYVRLRPGEAVSFHPPHETALVETAQSPSTGDAVPRTPITWSAAPSPLTKRGKVARVKLTATIAPGWHLYAMTQAAGGPIATKIDLAPDQRFTLASAVEAPEPRIVFDKAFGAQVGFYQGSAVFTLPVKVPGNVPAGTQSLVFTTYFQSCNEKLCLPPKTVKIGTSIVVR